MTEKIGLTAVLETSDFNAGIKDYNSGIDSMESANKGAVQSSEALSVGLSATDETMAESGKSAVELAASMEIVEQAYDQVKQIIGEALELAELGAQAERVEERFAAFAEEAGGANVILEAFQRGAGGAASKMESMVTGSRLLQMGLVDDAASMERVVEMSTRLGDQTQSVTDRVSDFALMLANQSTPRLDNFGISSGKVRARIAELTTGTNALTREAAFMQATMEQGALSLAKLGPRVDDNAAAFERAQAKMADTRVEIGQKLAPAAATLMSLLAGMESGTIALAAGLGTVLGILVKFSGGLGGLATKLGASGAQMGALGLAVVALVASVEFATDKLNKMNAAQEESKAAAADLGNQVSELVAGGMSLADATAVVTQQIQGSTDAWNDANAVQKGAIALLGQGGEFTDAMATATGSLRRGIFDSTGSFEEYSTAIAQHNATVTDGRAKIVAMSEALFENTKRGDEQRAHYEMLAEKAAEYGIVLDDDATELERVAAAMGDTSAAAENLTIATVLEAAAMGITLDATEDLTVATNDLELSARDQLLALEELTGAEKVSAETKQEMLAAAEKSAEAQAHSIAMTEKAARAQERSETTALAAAAAMEEKRQKDIALAKEETALAQSVMGASDAMIAQTFIQALDPERMGLTAYRRAVEDIQLAFGLATPESIAMAQGITDATEAANRGDIAYGDLVNTIDDLIDDPIAAAASMDQLTGSTDVSAESAGEAALALEGLEDAMGDTAAAATAQGAAIGANLAAGLLPAVHDLVDQFNAMLAEGITGNLPSSEPKNTSSPLYGLGKRGAAIMTNIADGMTGAAPVVAQAATDAGSAIGEALSSAILAEAAGNEELNALEELFGAAGVLGGLGGTAAGMLQRDTVQPLEEELRGAEDEIDRIRGIMAGVEKERQELMQERAGGVSAERELAINERLLQLEKNRRHLHQMWVDTDEDRVEAARKLAEQEERILRLQEAQERLGFLQQQAKLLDLIAEKGLDAEAILGGLELGVDASTEDVVDAMTRAIEAIIAQANEELGIASPSKVFQKIGQEAMTGMAMGIKDLMNLPVAQSALATQAMVQAPAMIAGSTRSTSIDQSRSMGDVNVNATVPNNAAANELGAIIRREVTRGFEGVR